LRQHPYISVTLIGILLGWAIWLCVPTEYSAVTKISDEYKEVDLAIGMSMIQSQIKAATGGDNTGTNDMEVYYHYLDSEDLLASLSKVRLGEKGITYGEYIGEEDTIEAIRDHLNYNYNGRQSTLTISFTDHDPSIASLMLDSVTTKLQQFVSNYRHIIAEQSLANAQKQMTASGDDYKKAQKRYDTFMDSHGSLVTQKEKTEEKMLASETKAAYKRYSEDTEKYVRYLSLLERDYYPFAVVQENTVPHEQKGFLISYLLSIPAILLFLTYWVRRYKVLQAAKAFQMDWGDFFSPWCLTIVIWTGDILLYFIQGTLDPIGPSFITCLTLWLLTFIPCSLISYWLSADERKPPVFDHRQPIKINIYLFYGFVVLSMLMSILYAKTIYNIVNQFDSENMLYNIRVLAVEGDGSYGLLNYTQGINMALFLVVIWLYPRVSKWIVALIVINNLVLELAMMEKSGILIMILGTLFVLYERGRIRVRTIGLTFAFIIAFFFFFNMSKEDADSDETMTFMDFFGMYITSPIVAFERLRMTISDTFATNTLNDFYPQLLRFGIKINVISRLQEFVFVPIPTNVYTIMQPFYNDFGRTGVAFFGFLYGSVFGYVYRKFREGNAMHKCFYTFLIEVIIIQFYNENLLQVFHLILEAVIIIFILVQSEKLSFAPSKQVISREAI